MLKNRGAAFALTAILAVGCVALWLSFSPQPSQAPRQYGRADKANSKGQPDADKGSIWKPSDAISLYTLVLAVFSGALVVVSFVQISYLRRADETARIAANAARDTVNKMDETARRQLRAYVNVNTAKILDPYIPEVRRAAIEIKNFGQTPSHHQIMWVGTIIREFPRREALRPAPTNVPTGRESLPPGRSSLIEVPIDPPGPLIETFLSGGQGAIYVWGEIRYADIFGNNQTTHFRLFCHGEMLPLGRLSAEAEGNQAT